MEKNGAINQAINAKESKEVSEEKEILNVSVIQAIDADEYGDLKENNLQQELDKIVGKSETKVYQDEKEFVVQFVEKDRYYEIDNKGIVEGPIPVVIDKNPGNIEKGINGEILDGTENTSFEIWCIEDLVELSQNYEKYENSYIKLGRTLNFNFDLSYSDGKMLGCKSIEELKELLTNKSGEGFLPISDFEGDFDGQKNSIKNIYVNVDGNAGLFANMNGIVKNLTITGSITSKEECAGGIIGVGNSNTTLKNCNNYANIISIKKSAGGIAGASAKEIDNCYNEGNVISYGKDRESTEYLTGCAGGIIGGGSVKTIQNCRNLGKITSTISAGGIIGYKYSGFYILNCCNAGEIDGGNYAAGIIGETKSGIGYIYNCYNTGKIQGINSVGGIVGYNYYTTTLHIYNCLNLGEVLNGTKIGGIIGHSAAGSGSYTSFFPDIINTYSHPSTVNGINNLNSNGITLFDNNLENVVDELNKYIENGQEEVDTSIWNKWIIDENKKIKWKKE